MRGDLKRMVEEVLKKYPETRNSDITLMIKIWEDYYPSRVRKGQNGQLGVWLSDLYELPREDNIKRIRAHFQNDMGQWLPTLPQVAKQRKIDSEKWRLYMSSLTEHKRI